jgi:hypothetical protein
MKGVTGESPGKRLCACDGKARGNGLDIQGKAVTGKDRRHDPLAPGRLCHFDNRTRIDQYIGPWSNAENPRGAPWNSPSARSTVTV